MPPKKKAKGEEAQEAENKTKNLANPLWRLPGEYLGVQPRGRVNEGQWTAFFVQRKTYLGVFSTPEEAAKAYDTCARKHQHWPLNFPTDEEIERHKVPPHPTHQPIPHHTNTQQCTHAHTQSPRMFHIRPTLQNPPIWPVRSPRYSDGRARVPDQ